MPSPAKTCGSCGAQGQNGAFCDECGETLPETTTASAAAASASASVSASAEAVPSTAPAPSFTPAPVPTVSSPEPPTRLDAFQPVPPADQPAAADSPVPSAPTVRLTQPAEPGPSTDDRARDMLLRVSESPKPENVAPPVLPDKPKPVVPVEWNKHQSESVTEGAPCPWCATLNPVGRHFCRRCAMSLESAPGEAAPARRPWWRRMLDWQNRPVPYAGQRPRLRRGPGQLARLLITLAIVLLLIIFASIFGGAAIEAIQDHFTTPRALPVQNITASTSGMGQPARNLLDGYSNTWWGTGGTVAGASLDVTLQAPSTVLDVIVTPGAGREQAEYVSQDSPKSLTLTMTSQNGQQTTQTLSLPSAAGSQIFPVHAKNISKIRVVVGPAYPGSSPDGQIALSGLEFFGH